MEQSIIWSFWNYWSCLKSDFTAEVWGFLWGHPSRWALRGSNWCVLSGNLQGTVLSPSLLLRPNNRWTLSCVWRKIIYLFSLAVTQVNKSVFNSSVWLLLWEKVFWQAAGKSLICRSEVRPQAGKMTDSSQPACGPFVSLGCHSIHQDYC